MIGPRECQKVAVVVLGLRLIEQCGIVVAQHGLVRAAKQAVVLGADARRLVFGRGLGGRRRRRCRRGPRSGLLDDLDFGRIGQAERGGKLRERQGDGVERRLVLVEMHGADIGNKGLLREMLEFGVLEQEGLELGGGVLDFGIACLDIGDGHVRVAEGREHALLFARQHEEQGFAVGMVSSRATDAVNVRVAALWRIDLDDPVDGGEVESAGGDVGREQRCMLTPPEVVKDLEAPNLLLLAVQGHERQAGAQLAEHLVHELHLATRAHKHQDLALRVGAQERKEDVELARQLHDHVELLEVLRHEGVGLASDIRGIAQTQPRQVLDAPRLRRGEQERLPRRWQVLENGIERAREAHIEDAVGLVEHEHLQIRHVESHRLVEVLQKSAGCGDQNVHLAQAILLVLEVLAADDQAGREGVLSTDAAQHVKDLHRELARRRNHEGA